MIQSQKYKGIDIFSFVNRDKMLSNNNNLVLFSSELYLIGQTQTQKPLLKYCVITRTDIKIFASKEAYLANPKKFNKIDINDISTYRRQISAKDKSLLQFCIILKSDTDEEYSPRLKNDGDLLRSKRSNLSKTSLTKRSNEGTDRLFCFGSKHGDIINKWIALIAYLTVNKK